MRSEQRAWLNTLPVTGSFGGAGPVQLQHDALLWWRLAPRLDAIREAIAAEVDD